jgi:hypothetical protein
LLQRGLESQEAPIVARADTVELSRARLHDTETFKVSEACALDLVALKQRIQQTIQAVGQLHGIDPQDWSFDTAARDLGDPVFQVSIWWRHGTTTECLVASLRCAHSGQRARLEPSDDLRRVFGASIPEGAL